MLCNRRRVFDARPAADRARIRRHRRKRLASDQPAPNWSEASLPGPRLSLASLHGKVIYLNFFATWCPPCNEEAPSIDALARTYASRGLQVVGVDVLENGRKAAAFRSEHRLTYPVVIDRGDLTRPVPGEWASGARLYRSKWNRSKDLGWRAFAGSHARQRRPHAALAW